MSRPLLTDYERRLNKLIDQIYARSADMTLKEFAAKAKLSVSTVHRIDQRKTLLPRLKTIMALANAVGMDVTLVAREARREI